MDDVKIKVIDSDKLINAIKEGSYDVNLSAVMALGAVMLDNKKQEKVGKWKKLSNNTFHCCECGKTFIVIQGQDHMNFCPNCGVEMRGEQE